MNCVGCVGVCGYYYIIFIVVMVDVSWHIAKCTIESYTIAWTANMFVMKLSKFVLLEIEIGVRSFFRRKGVYLHVIYVILVLNRKQFL